VGKASGAGEAAKLDAGELGAAEGSSSSSRRSLSSIPGRRRRWSAPERRGRRAESRVDLLLGGTRGGDMGMSGCGASRRLRICGWMGEGVAGADRKGGGGDSLGGPRGYPQASVLKPHFFKTCITYFLLKSREVVLSLLLKRMKVRHKLDPTFFRSCESASYVRTSALSSPRAPAPGAIPYARYSTPSARPHGRSPPRASSPRAPPVPPSLHDATALMG
jgi:hypothetical protein